MFQGELFIDFLIRNMQLISKVYLLAEFEDSIVRILLVEMNLTILLIKEGYNISNIYKNYRLKKAITKWFVINAFLTQYFDNILNREKNVLFEKCLNSLVVGYHEATVWSEGLF